MKSIANVLNTKSTNRLIILRIQSQRQQRDETVKTICKNRKANYLSTYRDSEGERDCSWEEKTKTLRFSFKKSTKFLINRDKSIKRLLLQLKTQW